MTITQYQFDLLKIRINYVEMQNQKATLIAISKELRRLHRAGDLTEGLIMRLKPQWFSQEMTMQLVKLVSKYFEWVAIYNPRLRCYTIAGGGVPDACDFIGEEVYAEIHESSL